MKNSRFSNHGFTIYEVIVVVVLIAIIAVLVTVTSAQNRQQVRSAHCASNLRQLAQANHAYANEFEDRFFYQWPDLDTTPSGEYGFQAGWWYDNYRLGDFLDEDTLDNLNVSDVARLRNLRFRVNNASADEVPASSVKAMRAYERVSALAGGILHCPAETIESERSYGFNYSASGALPLFDVDDAHNKEPAKIAFTRQSESIDQLILHADAFVSFQYKSIYEEDRWGLFGTDYTRFSGGSIKNEAGYIFSVERRVAYRHAVGHQGEDSPAANFATADGAVKRFAWEELVNKETQTTTGLASWTQ